MSDRHVGYSILLLLVAVLGGIFGYGIYRLISPPQVRYMRFSQVGNLSIGDYVCRQGVAIGQIRGMDVENQQIVVTAEFRKPLKVYENYSLVTTDKGLMGDRLITIVPGDSSSPLVPATDTLEGSFFVGVSEILGLAWKLEDAVHVLLSASRRMLNGTEANRSFVEQFNDVACAIDSLSLRLARATSRAHHELGTQLTMLNASLSSAHGVTRRLSAETPGVVAEADMLINDLDQFAQKLGDALMEVDKAVQTMRESDNLLWGDFASDLSTKLTELKQVVDDVQDGAGRLKLIISRLK